MPETESFYRHRIESIGLSIEVYQPWPLESNNVGSGVMIYQRIADNAGLVFIRYGENETIDSYMQNLTDSITTATVTSDKATVFCGHEARLVSIIRDRRAISVHTDRAGQGMMHEYQPQVRTIITLINFRHRGTLILVGYRIHEERFADFEPVLERIINSVETL
jgi:hypothetical protein